MLHRTIESFPTSCRKILRGKILMEFPRKPAPLMTSEELEAAIRAHRAETKRLLDEVRARRAAEKKKAPPEAPKAAH